VLHLFIVFDYILQWSCNLSASEVGIKKFNLFDCLLEVLVIVDNAVLEHTLKVATETNDVVNGVLGKWLQEKDERLLGFLDPIATHRSWAIEQENILSFVMIKVWFGWFGWEEGEIHTSITDSADRFAKMFLLKSEL